VCLVSFNPKTCSDSEVASNKKPAGLTAPRVRKVRRVAPRADRYCAGPLPCVSAGTAGEDVAPTGAGGTASAVAAGAVSAGRIDAASIGALALVAAGAAAIVVEVFSGGVALCSIGAGVIGAAIGAASGVG
jgi:hypothetical protein